MVYVQNVQNVGSKYGVYTVLYQDEEDLTGNGVLYSDEGVIRCKPGSLAYKAAFAEMCHFSGTEWVSITGGDES